MLSHYFTLRSLAHTFNERLRSTTIQQIFTQQRNELLISCSSDTESWALSVSCDPKLNYIFLRDSVARAKRNSVDLFTEAVPSTIVDISVHPHDRILQIELENGSTLCFLPFGPTANVFLINRDKMIIDAFKRTKELVGKPFVVKNGAPAHNALESLDDFQEALTGNDTKNIFAALKAAMPSLGSTLTREILHRSHTGEKALVENLSPEDMEDVQKQLREILKEVESPRPTLYYREEIPRLFSLIPLQHLGGSRAKPFASVNDAVRTFVVQTFRTQAVDAEKNILLSKIKNAIERTERSLHAMNEELEQSSRADEYERIAKILMANLQHLTKGTKVVDLPDIFSGERLTRIVLDPKLKPAQNAERYFEKAKKARRAREEVERRAETVKRELALLEKLQLHLDSCLTKEQLKEYQEEYRKELVDLKLMKPSPSERETPFRVFAVAGGFQVWAGKNSENNDLLTLKYAKSNDLWFHARGGSGSHVVLKVGTANGNPSKRAIEEAASIAAHFSKMRNAKMVPVAYCERKYVRKPKGSPAGTVSLQHEKILFVEPGLPAAK